MSNSAKKKWKKGDNCFINVYNPILRTREKVKGTIVMIESSRRTNKYIVQHINHNEEGGYLETSFKRSELNKFHLNIKEKIKIWRE